MINWIISILKPKQKKDFKNEKTNWRDDPNILFHHRYF